MDEANITVKSMASAEHTGHPGDDTIVATGSIKVLLDVRFSRGSCDLVLHFFDEYWDKGVSSRQAAILARIDSVVFEGVVNDIAPFDT